MRVSFVVLFLATSLILGSSGCGKVPTWGELSGGPQTPTDVPVVTAPPVQAAVVQSVAPAAPTPAEVIAKFQTLRTADINDTAFSQLTNLPEGLDQITEINADGSTVTTNAFNSIEKLTNLRQLRLTGSRIDNTACQKIARVSTLESLAISDTAVSDLGISALASLQNLKHLELTRCVLTADGFAAIGQLPAIESIQIKYTNLTNQFLALVCNAKTLKRLDLSNNQINDHGLEAMKKLSSLEALEVNSTGVSGVGLQFVQKGGGLKSLTSLGMYGCPMSGDGAKVISSFKSLERLNLGEILLMNDEALAYMTSGMKKLKFLNLTKCSNISGTGLSALKGCKELEELYIDHCPAIGDGVVPLLTPLKSLKLLAVHSSAISQTGISQLKAALPDAKIN